MLARGALTLIVGGLERGHHPRWIPHALESRDETFWVGFDEKERKMKRIMVIAVACALVLLVFSATASAKRVDRPFKGCVCGQVVYTSDPASPSPTGLWTDSSAVGCVSHLGRTVMSSRHPTPTGDTITGGTMKLVAANRDEVWIAYSGSAPYPVMGVPSTIVVAVDFTIVGGSGRFAHASGGGKMTGYVEFPGELNLGPWPAYWTWRHATIRY